MALQESLDRFKKQQEKCQSTLTSIASKKAAATPRAVPAAASRAPAPAVKFSNDTERLQHINSIRKGPVGAQIKRVIDLLLETRQVFTPELINEACYVDVNANKAVFDSLRNNPKVHYDGKRFSYKSKHALKDKNQLRSLIRKFSEGIPVIDLKDSYPTVMEDLQALKAAGDIWLLSNFDSQEDIAYPNDPRLPSSKVDDELKQFFRVIELPRDMLDIEKDLQKNGMKPATDTAKRRAMAQSQGIQAKSKPKKKKNEISKRTKLTNSHLPELFKTLKNFVAFLVHPFCTGGDRPPILISNHTQRLRHTHTEKESKNSERNSQSTGHHAHSSSLLHTLSHLSRKRRAPFNGFRSNGAANSRLGRKKNRGVIVSASEEQSSTPNLRKKRKIVEHVCLLKSKEDLSDEEEQDMLDYLYTTQYQMRGIAAISIGRISNENLDKYSHAFYLRFQRKENLVKFYQNPFYLGVFKEHVSPYCHGLLNVDYESEVEDDILPIFRKGEEFNFGVEFVLLISFVDNASDHAEDALISLEGLLMGFPSLIVQSTQGVNFNFSSKEYTHGVVIRFRSFDSFEIFFGSSEYKDLWKSKFEKITQKTLSVHFLIQPVGSEIM